MATLASLKTTMTITMITTLVVFAIFLAVVSLLYSYATETGLSADSVLLGSFILAGFFVLIQFAIGPWIIRVSTGLQYLKVGENPWLESTVQNLAAKAGVPMPKLARVPNPTPNAFVFGNSTRNMTLVVHDGLLQRLNEEEVIGVLAHELGHIKHRDSIIMTVLSALPLIAYIIARTTLSLRVYGSSGGRRGKDGGGAGLIVIAGVIALIVYFVTQLLVLSLSRKREHFADAFSGYLTGKPRSLQSALTKITYGLSLAPEDPHGARALYIGDPALAKSEIRSVMENANAYDLNRDGALDARELQMAMEQDARSKWKSVNESFSTHPPTFKRILLLAQIQRELESSGGIANPYKFI